eukprot:CAMPEP_0175859246 /NCGR_PEP_ID=MMETSP0107_2-20121207/30147_1 /TAXON_ID=195067 ORGANISM="Goniomonas pacifica, Strain CCMP1869" /NCGR_SAMPLE_ID=MMETSP0107_2 /ASSEMBLY_ACC=CAM_ASM_000203 /LENGTH=50 /DNA_ID=CAMNT_0017175841 /DNA_START=36 /DNA_END=188 /DNA_ORIENTATION=+
MTLLARGIAPMAAVLSTGFGCMLCARNTTLDTRHEVHNQQQMVKIEARGN